MILVPKCYVELESPPSYPSFGDDSFTFAGLVQSLAASLPLINGSTVYGWGDNSAGQLGSSAPVTATAPQHVTLPAAISAVAGGDSDTLALAADGAVWEWGQTAISGTATPPTPVADLSNIVAISAGYAQNLALDANGTVWQWPTCDSSLFGTVPTCTAPAPAPVSGLPRITAVASGGFHSLAVASDGTVWAWGSNAWGQLGDGMQPTQQLIAIVPVHVSGLANVVAIAAGADHSMALDTSGQVWQWGVTPCTAFCGFHCAEFVCDSDSIVTPTLVAALGDVRAIADGGDHSLALKSDGTVWAWGSNPADQAGPIPPPVQPFTGTTDQFYSFNASEYTFTPTQVLGLSDITVLSAGFQHNLALSAVGTVWAWGDNAQGQLGTATGDCNPTVTVPCSSVPLAVPGLSSTGVIAAGYHHSLALGMAMLVPTPATPSATATANPPATVPPVRPQDTSTPTIPSLAPLATPTSKPAPPTAAAPVSPPAVATAIPTHTTTPLITGSLPPRLALPLNLSRLPRHMASGSVLALRLRTATHGLVQFTVQLWRTRTVWSGSGTHRKRIARRVLLYQVTRRGQASARGALTERLRISYAPVRPVIMVLTVTVRSGQRTRARTYNLTVEPARPGAPGG